MYCLCQSPIFATSSCCLLSACDRASLRSATSWLAARRLMMFSTKVSGEIVPSLSLAAVFGLSGRETEDSDGVCERVLFATGVGSFRGSCADPEQMSTSSPAGSGVIAVPFSLLENSRMMGWFVILLLFLSRLTPGMFGVIVECDTTSSGSLASSSCFTFGVSTPGCLVLRVAADSNSCLGIFAPRFTGGRFSVSRTRDSGALPSDALGWPS